MPENVLSIYFELVPEQNFSYKENILVDNKKGLPCVVVVFHKTISEIGYGLLKKFWPLVIGCVLRTAGSSII